MCDSTEYDLLEAVKESLNNDGTIGKFKAELRAAVMNVLNKNNATPIPPKVPEETKIINELIREYMTWNGYMFTEQIFSAETGQLKERLDRDVLTSKIGVQDDTKTNKIPLLYYVVSAFQNKDAELLLSQLSNKNNE